MPLGTRMKHVHAELHALTCVAQVVALQQAEAGWCIEVDRSSNGGPPKRMKLYASKVVLAVGGRQETPLSAFSTTHQARQDSPVSVPPRNISCPDR